MQFGAVVNAALTPALEQRPTLGCLLAALQRIRAGGSINDVQEWECYERPPDLEEELRDEWACSEADASSGHSGDATSSCADDPSDDDPDHD